MNDYVIEASGINISFDSVQILYGVDFHVKRGEVHALVGSNGAGKSTLMKIINGVYQKDTGTISVFGEEKGYFSPQTARQAGIAMVFQDLSLIPSLTVSENVFLQTHPFRKGLLIDDRKALLRTREFLSLIGVDTEIKPTDRVESLSVGQQQIVEIAKALSGNPKVLILDEPTASLSHAEINLLFKVIDSLRKQNISIIYITHYLQDIFKICDSLTLLRDGKVAFRKETSEFNLQTLIDAMTGNQSEKIPWNRNIDRESSTPILKVVDLTTEHVRGISLEIHPGEVVGLAGLLGSGRSELLNALYGMDRHISGEIHIRGKIVHVNSSSTAIKEGIALVPGNRREQGLILDFPVAENMVLPIIKHLKGFLMVKLDEIRKLAEHYISSLKIKTLGPQQVVRFLSGGNQQKIVVAKCLASDSRILLLDDPTFGVDIGAKREIMKIIHEYASRGNGVLFISSEFNEIAEFCDSIYIMKKGQIKGFVNERTTEDELLLKVQ